MYRKASFLLVLFSLTACTHLSPFVDSRREAGQIQPIGQSKPDRIAICYHPLWDTDSEIEQLAKASCPSHHIKPDGKKYFNCCLSAPNTAFYRCTK